MIKGASLDRATVALGRHQESPEPQAGRSQAASGSVTSVICVILSPGVGAMEERILKSQEKRCCLSLVLKDNTANRRREALGESVSHLESN